MQRSARRYRSHGALLALVALGACGGRSTLELLDHEVVVVVVTEASTTTVLADAAEAPVPQPAAAPVTDASVEASVDAGRDDETLDAAVEPTVDAGSGICPEPPLLTGSGVPAAPSYIEQLALGNEHTCLLVDGQVWCWGKNRAGELGDGTQVSRARPTRVKGLSTAVAIASGPAFDIGCHAARGSHTCALINDGTVRCWGSNVAGEVSWFVPSLEPIAIPGLVGVSKLGVGGYANCAIHHDGTASCWGLEAKPFLGFDGGLTDIAASTYVFAARKDGTVWTWGASTSKASTTFTAVAQVPTLASITSVVAGWGHQCALRSNGTVWCWGSNLYGQLGDGTSGNQSATPVQAVGVTNAVRIGVGSRSTCAVLADGTMKCWGDNSHGQMGVGTFGGAQSTPTLVPGLDEVVEIRGGFRHLCARRWDMSVWCWGANESGEVGDGTTNDRAAPVQVFP